MCHPLTKELGTAGIVDIFELVIHGDQLAEDHGLRKEETERDFSSSRRPRPSPRWRRGRRHSTTDRVETSGGCGLVDGADGGQPRRATAVPSTSTISES